MAPITRRRRPAPAAPRIPHPPNEEISLAADPVLAVLSRTDAFVRVWPAIAESAGAALHVARTVADLPPAAEVVGTILGVGGEEAAAAELVAAARAGGAAAIVVVGAAADHRPAVAAVRAGAANYFSLPGELEALRAWCVERVEHVRGRERVAKLTAHERSRYDFSQLVGESRALREALDRASSIIGRGSTTVLITGETGTGKELLAQAIHYNGPRAQQPFVGINCTALPATLLEAELFGFEKGAFTDARAAKPGLFEAAHGGTLFLDEIGDLSLDLQAKLLKVLEDREIRRLGSLRSRRVDVRLITATHRDIAAATRQGGFRRDLFFRLAVIPIHLPPLRDRGEDVFLLATHFIDQFAAEYDLPRPPLSSGLRAALRAHAWPGNVRELRNSVERAMLLGNGRLSPDHLFLDDAVSLSHPVDTTLPFPATLDRIEAAAARAMLEHCEGNKRAAAQALGISRSRLYRLLERSD